MWIFLQHPCNPSRIYFQHFQALRCSWSGICPHWTRQSLVSELESLHEGDRELNRIYHTPIHTLIFTIGSPKLRFVSFEVLNLFHTKNFLKMCSSTSLLQLSCFRSLSQNGIRFCGTSRDFQQTIALFTQQTQGCSLKWQSSQSSQAGWNPRSTCYHIIWILQLSISRASATSEVAIPSFTPGEASDAYQNRDHSAAIILEVAPGGTNRSQHGMAPGSLIAESVWVGASCCWWTYSLLSWFSRNSAIYSNIL